MTTNEMIKPYIDKAIEARDNDCYADFLASIEDKNIHDLFAKYLNRPEGKGWVFDFNQCKWFRIRKLTPTECYTLMGVRKKFIDRIQAYPLTPDSEHPDYTNAEKLASMTEKERKAIVRESISESQQYKQAGNSIVVDVMRDCFRNLLFPSHREVVNEEPTLF